MDKAEELAARVKELFRSSPDHPREMIETFLSGELKGHDRETRLEMLQRIRSTLARETSVQSPPCPEDPAILNRLAPLLLGNRLSKEDLCSSEVLEQLSASLNTLFDTLNELIHTVEENLQGRADESATIRTVIASEVSGTAKTRPLHEHLSQIKEAFLVAHTSFQESSTALMQEVLQALSPQALERKSGGGLKFGALKRADLYEIYKNEYENIRIWFETGRFRDRLLHEFEKSCQQKYKHKGK